MGQLGSVCVFCGSSSGRRPAYREAVVAVAEALVARDLTVVYGGASVGLMGLLADTALAAGGRVVGVIPRYLADIEIAHDGLTELHLVADLAERQETMGRISDGYLSLPGGFGTLDELFEMAVRTQLHLDAKPSAVLDVAGYYHHLRAFLDHAVDEGLLSRPSLDALLFDDDPERLLDRMADFVAPTEGKWLD